MKRSLVIMSVLFLTLVISAYLFLFRNSDKYIFLITLDTTRADHINYSLKDNNLTPNLAKLASKGRHYKNAFSLIPITLPSHSTMFYSLPPHILKVYNNVNTVNESQESLIQILKKNGYSTHGIISLGVLRSEYGLNKGFDEVRENFPEGFFYRDAMAVNRDAFDLLGDLKKEGKKNFYWIHYSDPHSPYFTPFYKGGEFSIFFNKEPVFKCQSTDHRKVELQLDLLPGKNHLKFITHIPRRIKFTNKIHIGAVSFLNFKIKSEFPKKDYRVIFPSYWNEREDRHELNVGTLSRKSEIILINRRKSKIRINIVFVYRIIETKPSSKYLYSESVKFLDKQIGRFISFLKKKKIYKKSVFIIMGDHGEGLGEFKDFIGHVIYLNGLFTRVPLIITGEGIDKKGEISTPVSALDIAPTILKIAGIKKPSYMMGKDLFKLKKKRIIFFETYSPEAYYDGFSILDYPYQLIYYPDRKDENFEFYDLSSDYNGINSLINLKKFHMIVGELKKKLINFARNRKKRERKKTTLTRSQKDMLRSLGYL